MTCSLLGYYGKGATLSDLVYLLCRQYFRARIGIGIAFKHSIHDRVYIVKTMGNKPINISDALAGKKLWEWFIDHVKNKGYNINEEVNIFLGHLRYATVSPGEVDDKLAHPFVYKDEEYEITIIHNGDLGGHILLHRILRNIVKYDSHYLPLTSDSAVIPLIIREYINLYGNADEGFTNFAKDFSLSNQTYGTIIALIIDKISMSSVLYFMKYDMPLVMLNNESGTFLASDIYAFYDPILGDTKELKITVFLEEPNKPFIGKIEGPNTIKALSDYSTSYTINVEPILDDFEHHHCPYNKYHYPHTHILRKWDKRTLSFDWRIKGITNKIRDEIKRNVTSEIGESRGICLECYIRILLDKGYLS